MTSTNTAKPGGNLPRIVYLGGLGRSGTTLLERLLGELPGVCSAGEVVHLWQRGIADAERCGCGEPLPDCPFWREAGRAAFGGWAELDVRRVTGLRSAIDRSRHIPLLAAPVLPPSLRRGLGEYVGYYLRIYSAIASVSGCPVVVDSSKHASLAFCLRWRAELDLRVIHVVRDSRAVAFSWTRQVSRPESASDPYMPTYSPARAAWLWNARLRRRWPASPTLPGFRLTARNWTSWAGTMARAGRIWAQPTRPRGTRCGSQQVRS